MTPLQFQILLALKKADPAPLSDVAIWVETGGHQLGGHGASCVMACLDLKDRGLIELSPGSSWQLTAQGREVLP